MPTTNGALSLKSIGYALIIFVILSIISIISDSKFKLTIDPGYLYLTDSNFYIIASISNASSSTHSSSDFLSPFY